MKKKRAAAAEAPYTGIHCSWLLAFASPLSGELACLGTGNGLYYEFPEAETSLFQKHIRLVRKKSRGSGGAAHTFVSARSADVASAADSSVLAPPKIPTYRYRRRRRGPTDGSIKAAPRIHTLGMLVVQEKRPWPRRREVTRSAARPNTRLWCVFVTGVCRPGSLRVRATQRRPAINIGDPATWRRLLLLEVQPSGELQDPCTGATTGRRHGKVSFTLFKAAAVDIISPRRISRSVLLLSRQPT
ncbi:hypothetical protein HPB50_026926 [Hyalomma asiaticum]|uniref:Uncharacterized protein n=1 Tax=Hyalomma asiaticum TaxID=266040 RepID=A0ACB7T2J6_HYAAI|nr:hypothetical protein HPB50_026926 [Hyalomma asiaticum]